MQALSLNLAGFFRSQIFPILLVNFIGALGYGIILPFLAFLIIDFGGNEIIYGIVASTYPIFQMLGAPLLGAWSDKIGRKKVLLISQFGTLLSWLIFLLAFYLPVEKLFTIESNFLGEIMFTLPLVVVLIARSLDGLTGGNISVANAYLSDITTEKDRKKNFGLMAASMSLGFILGPAIAGLLAIFPNGNFITIIVTASVSLFGYFAIRKFLPETPLRKEVFPCKNAKFKKAFGVEYKECHDADVKNKSGWKSVVNQQKAPLMIFLFFLVFLAINLFYATFSMHSSLNLNWDAKQVGFFFTLLSFLMIIGQGPLLTRLSKKYSEEKLFSTGAIIMVISFLLFTNSQNIIVYLGAILYGIGNGIMWPSYLTMLSKIGDPSKQGALQGIANSAGSFAAIIGLIFGGILLTLLSGKIYIISAVILCTIGLIGWKLNRKKSSLNL